MANLSQNMQGGSIGKGRLSQALKVHSSRPWTAPENRGQNIPKLRKAIVPMQLQTTVLPMFQKMAGDGDSGRITADSVLRLVSQLGKSYDELKIRDMIQEMDYEGVGLSLASVRGALEGSHRYRKYGPSDWLELVALVLGISVKRLALSMDAAVPSTKMPASEPGKSVEREKEIKPVWSKSSSKYPGRKASEQQFTPPGHEIDKSRPNPWSSLIRNGDATSTTLHNRTTRVVAPTGCATLDQGYNERSVNICLHQTRSARKMTFEAQTEFNAHAGRLAAGDMMSRASNTKTGFDPRKTQSARYEKKSTEFYLAHKRPTKPVNSKFISMTGVPPVAYGLRAKGRDELPTEAAELAQNAWRDPDAYLSGPKPPSSKQGYYRCVRVNKSAVVGTGTRQKVPTSAAHRPTAARGERHHSSSSAKTTRPSTTAQVMSSSINPLVRADSLRLEGCLSIEGGLLQPGADVQGPQAEFGKSYPQPPSELKKLRHDITQTLKPPFIPYARPLATGLHSTDDFQTLLGGCKATIPIQFWRGERPVTAGMVYPS